ncbi:MAG TPA: hypothetical protein VN922_16695 [Bacteroidia bacterium]|nr:hypothetical protein [Bacteroidia bacterium]
METEFKGTKGPWIAQEHPNNKIPIVVGPKKDNGKKDIICLSPIMAEAEISMTNMKLIAAAPELLEALIELLSHAPSVEDLGGDESAFTNSFGVAIAKAQQAINTALNG